MADRPNVLLICVEHWPGKMIGRLGHHSILTPTLDQCIANGVAFTSAYTTTPMCVPARRELMTGTFSRTHGDRFQGSLPMPDVPTVAQGFRDAGYQAYAVGKLHVNPSRNRIGFDDVLVNEEGRPRPAGTVDDYELFLTEQGYSGLFGASGLHNTWDYRPWHLPEYCHHTNWTAREISRYIVRRDPTRPAFWYASFSAPHPPLTPLQGYMDIYRDMDIPMPFAGEWAKSFDDLPFALKARPARQRDILKSESDTKRARRAFYALATHVDHQIRAIIGTLRDEGIEENTIIMVTADHGDMEGNHRLWNKMVYYEGAANIPMILVPTAEQADRIGYDRLDDRIVAQADVMPTLLDLCDVPIPDTVDGMSMVGETRREYLYSEFYENDMATRSVRGARHKLIYYAVGNRTQLFDLEEDPDEMRDVADDPKYADVRERLTGLLIQNLYGGDLEWLDGDRLVGLPDKEWSPKHDYGLSHGNQRGYRFR